jgi:phenylacetic acid degradation operon negative regulatory protein
MASALLGTVPPVLPGRLLVALAREFGITEGTARVALSRMVDRGELTNHDGTYALSGQLVERQQRQQAGLRPATRSWTGAWEMAVVRPGARTTEDRSALRTALGRLGLSEHREGVWLRPDNLDADRLPAQRRIADAQADRFTARPDGDPVTLTAGLFDLETWADRAMDLITSMKEIQMHLEDDDRTVLVPGFELAAAVLRHFVADPLLPDAVLPDDWPATELRATHARYDVAYRHVLKNFFRDHRES